MGRIEDAFAQLRRAGKKGFIPFITAGDPDLQTTEKLLIELAQAHSTVIELGVPFSDPMADGPVIQRSSERALNQNVSLQAVIDVAARARTKIQTPIILFSYFNPLLQFGLKRLATTAKEAGVDGILVTDLTPEEAVDFETELRRNELDMIFLTAPTSTDARLKLIAERASGFIYAVSRAGVTGEQASVSEEAEKLVSRVRQFSSLPVAVGFGVSTREQVVDVQRYADAVVVGSAIVSQIERTAAVAAVPGSVREFVRGLINE
ncbi:MAG: tryptophan synthase subunit alpha [Blastocatellia bacterium]|nr:MAG: tryptophan synthase subunit alpha [Blastocatellia bacterium]